MSNPPRLRDFPGFLRPRFCLSRQPTGARGQPGASEAGAWPCRPCRRRERPLGAALNLYRKFSQRRSAARQRYGESSFPMPGGNDTSPTRTETPVPWRSHVTFMCCPISPLRPGGSGTGSASRLYGPAI